MRMIVYGMVWHGMVAAKGHGGLNPDLLKSFLPLFVLEIQLVLGRLQITNLLILFGGFRCNDGSGDYCSSRDGGEEGHDCEGRAWAA